ncbi:Delta(24)-sterol [Cyphellophora attinorum]|uniref:Delta(24)-sterol reductase n=1 Tax=Cyphellophora attinorum TaxID=1664694 RepID=A0A0N1NY43_9EURO|nr:Delta(24)-sterol [Phialophora attinorum]KPI36065.1 Delta(24)-sterol [Phialophora attinorum]
MEAHRQKIVPLAQKVAEFHSQKLPFRIYHGSTNSTRSTTFSDATSIDTSTLNNVISIDTEERTCVVESNVPMDQLVAFTTPYRLVPPVVPEFPGITVGGAFSGTGGESSSFRYGFFDQCVLWIEAIQADGTVVSASPNENADLFNGCSGTFGTIATVTLLKIKLLPARDFVEMTYHPVDSFPDAQGLMAELSSLEAIDFVDGIMFSKSQGVIVSGRMVNLDEYESSVAPPMVTFSQRWDQWFYLHAENAMSRQSLCKSPHRELATLPEYLFRYDRGAFWTGKFVFQWFGVPFNRMTRYLLNWLMDTRTLYHGLHASKLGAAYIIQDFSLPDSKAVEFLDWLDETYEFYPLWLCPLKQNDRNSLNPHVPCSETPGRSTGEQLLNIGVWTKCPDEGRLPSNRKLEAKLRELQGMKWLYADTFYTEEEFWSIYDREEYDSLRQKYSAEYLPNVWRKVRTVVREPARSHPGVRSLSSYLPHRMLRDLNLWSRWPLVGITAVLSYLQGLEYLKDPA